ncbi:hypothetical protein [Streptomyces sp. NBC_00078]|uniref:hypothetical protein n=1 Tax=unclassified Streptomyces TaxID=2593676 RepID=UPI00224D47AA|nr:hypothetical protein [Streptomyces sp. NBC_00078]MCX5425485.1 hypothetical protein [Streptomyces sp. NBC_00078]
MAAKYALTVSAGLALIDAEGELRLVACVGVKLGGGSVGLGVRVASVVGEGDHVVGTVPTGFSESELVRWVIPK